MTAPTTPLATATSKQRQAFVLGGLLAGLAGLLLASRLVPFQIDDAYIYYRYAENLAAGFGPTFNRGQPPVEGFTSLLWTLALGGAAKVAGSASLPLTSMLMGMLAYAVCVALIIRLAGRAVSFTVMPWWMAVIAACAPATVWSCSPGVVYYALTGLETLAFVALVLAFHGALSGKIDVRIGMAAGALALWVRPEGAWLAVAAAAQLTASWMPRDRLRPLLWRLGGALLIGSLIFLTVRWTIFHDLLPNTYYAKEPIPGGGLRYLKGGLHTGWFMAIIVAGVIGGGVGTPAHRGFAAAGLAWIGAAVLEGGDWMPGGRLFQPALALFAVAGSGCLQAGERLRRLPVCWGAAIALACLLPIEVNSTFDRLDRARRLDSEHSEITGFIDWVHASGLASIALVDIGEVGFIYPDVSIVDLAGLTDREIAHAPGGLHRKKIDTSYVFERTRPDVIVIRLMDMPERDAAHQLAPDPKLAMSIPERDLLQDERLLKEYRPLFLRMPGASRDPLYAQMVYVRRDLAVPPSAVPPVDVLQMSKWHLR